MIRLDLFLTVELLTQDRGPPVSDPALIALEGLRVDVVILVDRRVRFADVDDRLELRLTSFAQRRDSRRGGQENPRNDVAM